MRLKFLYFDIFILFLRYTSLLNAELYTSVEQLSRWNTILEQQIRHEENMLARLYDLKNATVGSASSLENPIAAFTSLNRVVELVENIQNYFEEDVKTSPSILERLLPSYEDMVGCGEAILRLQLFYNLSIEDLAQGILPSQFVMIDQDVQPRRNVTMNPKDCFELGRIAYSSGNFKLAAQWFEKSLNLILKENNCTDSQLSNLESLKDPNSPSDTADEGINELLDYLAFAAYQNGDLDYAAKLTHIWLSREPSNDRALENLEYYLEEINQTLGTQSEEQNKEDTAQIISTSNQKNLQDESTDNIYATDQTLDASTYVLTEDRVVQDLCRGSAYKLENYHRCIMKSPSDWNIYIPEFKIEVLSDKPKIIRVYDIINDREATHIRQIAMPRLERSTVRSKGGTVTSDFRLAKTAWIPSDLNETIEIVEARIQSLMGIYLYGSEDLQVVNYGFGGFYGPHLDSARKTKREYLDDSSVLVDELYKSDRLATVLIYLNQVQAGGSTVFPKLNLTVEPIKNSAVIWYNIKKDGFSDGQTLHSGCPVLLGSKWIATKWPREEANILVRPCGLSEND